MARTPGADARLMARLRDADPAPSSELDERAEADLAAILATQTVVTLPPRRRPLVLVAAAAVVALGFGAVATGVVQRDDDGARGGPPVAAADSPGGTFAAPDGSPSRVDAMAAAPDAQALLDGLSGGALFDDDPAGSPAELAESSTVVLTGTVVSADRLMGTTTCQGTGDPVTNGPEVLLRLEGVQVAKGQVSTTPVEVVAPLGGTGALQTLLPVGTQVLVYAGPGIGVDCGNVLRVTGPQGLAVQAAGGQVVWPMIGEVRDGDLSQALPGGTLIGVEQ